MDYTVKTYLEKLKIRHSIPDRSAVGEVLFFTYLKETGERPVKVEQVEKTTNNKKWKVGVASYPESWLRTKVRLIILSLIQCRLEYERDKPVYINLMKTKIYHKICNAGSRDGRSVESISLYLANKFYIPATTERAMEATPKKVMRKRRRKQAR